VSKNYLKTITSLLTNAYTCVSYWKPERTIAPTFTRECLEQLEWKDEQDEALIAGISQYGLDWTQIIIIYLPNWDALELAERCCKLLGLKSVKKLEARYKNWKGKKQDFEKGM